MTKKCLVSGAAGFIGSRLCRHLLEQGLRVIGVDAFTDSYDPNEKLARASALASDPRFSLVTGPLTELPMGEILDGVEVVYHLAGRAGVRASFALPSRYRLENVVSTARLLRASRQAHSVRRLVYASSSSVYGNAPVPFREDGETRPLSPYGWTKLEAERLCLAADGDDLETVALRYFTVYGPGQRPDMGLRIFAEAALAGRPLRVFGDGSQTRDFTFVDDVVRATHNAASAPASGIAINVAGGSRITLTETLALLSRILAKPLNVYHEHFAAGDALHTGADLTRARKLLSFEPSTAFEDGLQAEVDWIRRLQAREGKAA